MTRPIRIYRWLGPALLSVLVGACSNRIPDLEPPTLAFVELQLAGDDSTGQLRLDNPVAAPIPASRLLFDLSLDGQLVGQFERVLGLTIPPLGRETVRIEFDAPQAIMAMIDADAPRGQLEYRIEGRLELDTGSALRFDEQGRLYPTPGKPGSWR